jgi:predicted pyridoxine 5'-phosphate oxidase superfamily flavin-nucleotide-binding protein
VSTESWQQLFHDGGSTVGTLSTCDDDGQPNAALFGSARLLGDGRLAIALGDNRTLRNLRRHPQAVFLLARPGATLLAWQGVRLYLRLDGLESDGALFTALQEETARVAGRHAARRLQAVALFHIAATRPLLDLGA